MEVRADCKKNEKKIAKIWKKFVKKVEKQFMAFKRK